MYNERRLFLIVFTATLSCFLNGYELGVLNTSIDAISDTMGWSGSEKTFFISLCTGLLCLGAVCGASISAFARIGRRKLLMYNSVLAVVASIVNIFANSYSFVIGRFLGGIVAGIGSTISPIYVNEFAPVAISGKLGSMV
jgi:MFS family permease